MRIPAVILAAGASTRLGRPKQLVEFEGETLLNRAIRLAREAGAEPVFAVLGSDFESIAITVPPEIAVLVHNHEWQTGMASSIRAGLRAVEASAPDAAAVLLLTCDQPRLTPEHLRRLIAAGEESGTIATSVYAGRRGTPAVLPRQTFAALAALQGEEGARSILRNPPCAVTEVEFAGGEFDVDEPADLLKLK